MIALSQIRKTGERGRVRAWIAIVVSILIVILAINGLANHLDAQTSKYYYPEHAYIKVGEDGKDDYYNDLDDDGYTDYVDPGTSDSSSYSSSSDSSSSNSSSSDSQDNSNSSDANSDANSDSSSD